MAHQSTTSDKSFEVQSVKIAGPVTFGVEIEANLAFKESKLQSILDRYYDKRAVIVKAFPDSAHDAFLNVADQSHQCRNLYPSWALEVPIETDTSLQLTQSTTITGREGKVRRYLAEPLIMAKEILGDTTIPVEIRSQLRRGEKTITLGREEPTSSIILQSQSADYQKWTLTSDHTLIGCLDNQLIKAVGSQAFKVKNIRDPDGTIRSVREKKWDSAGFELVSPVFKWSQQNHAFTSVHQCLKRLSSGSGHRAVTSKWASLQVHVGLDIQHSNMISLPTLQHLAFILINHEDLITKLHPRSRCGLPVKEEPEHIEEIEDLDNFDYEDYDPEAPPPPEPTPAELAAEDEQYLETNNERVLAAEARYTGYNTTNSNARYFCRATGSQYPPTQQHIASQIFQPGMTLTQLVSMLQKPSTKAQDAEKGHRYRGYMYNFDNLLTMYLEDGSAWKTGKPTIEFRQHACTTDPMEVEQWTRLCFAIVEFAREMASREGTSIGEESLDGKWRTEAGKYTTAGHWPCEGIEGFLEILELDGEVKRYWMRRYGMFENDRPTEDEVDHEAF